MKRLLIAGALAFAAVGQAGAADLPQAAPPPPQAPATYVPTVEPTYNWSGIYLGINGGYAFGNSTWGSPASTGSFSTNGFVVGGTLGANYQINAFVLGVEGDFDWTNINGSASSNSNPLLAPTCGGTGLSCKTANDWLGTVRGRLGLAVNRVLFYGTGGVAFGNVEAGVTPPDNFDTNTKIGWTAGAGIEAAFTDNLTARIEYLFVDLSDGTCSSSTNCGGTGVLSAAGSSVSFNASLVRAGIDYKFGY